jgi:putative two-component system response regulator
MPRPDRILIADDEAGIRLALGRYLRENGYPQVDEASDGEQAAELLRRHEYFFVITDISMPSVTGLELLALVRRDHPATDVAVITGQLEVDFAIQALKNGAFDYFHKPFRFDEVLQTIERVRHKQFLEHRSRELEILQERTRADENHLLELMHALANIIDLKSPYTRQHSDRVAKFAVLLGRRVGLTRTELERIALGASLHDIGKLGCPDCILNKPGALTRDEYSIIQQHPGSGASLCGHVSSLKPVLPMIRWHHENLDGSGYPDQLKGDQIPLEARIVRIADYWDAITSQRAYRNPMTPEQARATIESEAELGRLDPVLTNHLFACLHEGALGRVKAVEEPRFSSTNEY